MEVRGYRPIDQTLLTSRSVSFHVGGGDELVILNVVVD